MKKIDKKTFLAVGIVVMFLASSFLLAFAIQSGVDYIVLLVRNEQEDHYIRMQRNIIELKDTTNELEDYIDLIQKRLLSREEKLEVAEKLRHLEEIALNVHQERFYYEEDVTVHMFFTPEEKVDKYFENTRNTPLYIDRFVRTTEEGLFSGYLTQNQRDMITANFELLVSEIDSL